MNAFDLTGKAAIVTGGNDGIGRGIAIGLASAGASVCIAGRNETKNEQVRMEIEKGGHAAIAVACDVNVEADVEAAIAAIEEACGSVDILVNNAGIAELDAP